MAWETTQFLLPQLFLKHKLGTAHLLEEKKIKGNRIVTDEQNVIHMQNGLANQQELTPCWRKLKKNNRNHYHAGGID